MYRGFEYDYMAYGPPPPRRRRMPPPRAMNGYGGGYSGYRGDHGAASLMNDLEAAAYLHEYEAVLAEEYAMGLENPYGGGWDRYHEEPVLMHPPQRRRFPRAPRQPRPARGRGGMTNRVSSYGAGLDNRQIMKAQERFLGPQTKSKPTITKDNETTASTSTQNEENNNNTGDKKSAENAVTTPVVPLKSKITAKQQWETSYVETMKEESLRPKPEPVIPSPAKKNIEPTPIPALMDQPQVSGLQKSSSKKRKNDWFRRGPYFRRKKKKTSESEGAAQEPGFGFDVNGTNEGSKVTGSEEGTTYPKTCKVCNVKLYQPSQADDHYKSEIHAKNVNNFLSGEDTKKIERKINKITENLPTPINTPECLVWEKDTGDRTQNTVRFCRLCSVEMSSLPTAKQHYAGKAHAKRIRIVQRGNRPYRKPFKPTHFVSGGVLGIQEKPIEPAYSYNPAAHLAFTQPDSQIANSSINFKPSLPGDFANSMTPSGQYYCQTCNIVIEHAGSLSTHLQSKQHKLAKARS
uniref:uncharacterized protein LOC120332236 n=1 Tax=Styela clava TaxID=7725 RepID=UPI00193944B9|nr:uncharacterized protein LOC120332236 [Styela clava]